MIQKKQRYFYCLWGALLLCIVSCTTVNTQVQVDKSTDNATVLADSFPHLAPKKVYQLTKNSQNWVILDVRTPKEVAASHIPKASPVNFRSTDFNQQVQLLDKQKTIYIYCNTGVGRSDSAAVALRKDGFKNVNIIKGGILGWDDNNLPLITSKNTATQASKKISLADFNQLLNTNQPVLVDFHTTWCASCVEMIPVVDTLKEAFAGRAKVLRIDINANKAIRKAYQISGVPVFILFKNGKQQWIHKGKISKVNLANKIKEYIPSTKA